MTDIVTREVGSTAKNAPLTNAELDQNLINLNSYKVEQTGATGAAAIPSGADGDRPTAAPNLLRFNTTKGCFESPIDGDWVSFGAFGVADSEPSGATLDLSDFKEAVADIQLSTNITTLVLPLGRSGVRIDLCMQFTQPVAGGIAIGGWPSGVKFESGIPPAVDPQPNAVTQILLSNINDGGWVVYNRSQTAADTLMLRLPSTQRLVIGAVGGSSLIAAAMTAAREYYIPFTVPRPIQVASLGISVSTAAAGTGTLGIYASDGDPVYDKPGTLLATTATGAVNTGTTGTKLASIDITLIPGVQYWVGLINSSAATVRSIPIAAQGTALGYNDALLTAVSCLYRVGSTNNLPGPAPSALLLLAAANIPGIYLVEAL